MSDPSQNAPTATPTPKRVPPPKPRPKVVGEAVASSPSVAAVAPAAELPELAGQLVAAPPADAYERGELAIVGAMESCAARIAESSTPQEFQELSAAMERLASAHATYSDLGSTSDDEVEE